MSKRDSYEHRETVNEKDKNALKNSERMGKRTTFVKIKRKKYQKNCRKMKETEVCSLNAWEINYYHCQTSIFVPCSLCVLFYRIVFVVFVIVCSLK